MAFTGFNMVTARNLKLICVFQAYYINLICGLKGKSFYMAAVVILLVVHSHNIAACHRNQPNKSKLLLYNPLIFCNSGLNQCFSYKDGCGIHGNLHIDTFKRSWLGI